MSETRPGDPIAGGEETKVTSKLSARLARALCLLVSLAVPASADTPSLHPNQWPAAKQARLLDPAIEKKIDTLMAGMSLEEKVGQVIQADISTITPDDLRRYPLGSVLAGGNSGPGGNDRAPPQAWLDLADAFYRVSMEKRPGHTRIPLIFGIDAVHGHGNIGAATIFPHNIGLGAAHDPDLLRRIGQVTAVEIAATGIDWTFAPALSVVRDDHWGRTYEGYSEDPQIVAAYAGAMVEGVQGVAGSKDFMAPGHTAATAKHFLADGGTDGGRNEGDASIAEADLIGLHNAGYPPAIDAGVLTIMASLSSWQGIKHHGDRALLTDILKGRMGFNGFVLGDWNGHDQVPGCTKYNCPTAFNAGLDMFMAPDSWQKLFANTLAQVQDGTIAMARLDDAVRRILRVKFQAGLFDKPAPKDRRDIPALSSLGSPDHRAVAREAVRKSLVLLKNQAGILPLSPRSRVLVAGDGADNIGKQSGGWTISWQGTGNRNDEFPGATSILGGVRNAVTAAGGTVTYDADGAFQQRPDVAIVVFGEEPYAETLGDVETVEYQPGSKSDLALLKRLKDQGIPTVAVLLSGRPLWVNPEINASSAFVAAWLPGSEGGGIADLLFRSPDGAVKYDFTGKLSFSWPRSAAQAPQNRGDAHYDPQFAYGYGLTYKDKGDLPQLSEDSGLPPYSSAGKSVFFRRGGPVSPWALLLADKGGDRRITTTAGTSPDGIITMKSVDISGQEDAKQVTWNGTGLGSMVFYGRTVDLSALADQGASLSLRWRVDQAPTGRAAISMTCDDGCRADIFVTKLLAKAPAGSFVTTRIPLKCFAAAGARLASLNAPVVISSDGMMGLTITDLKLDTNPADATCPDQ